MALNRWSDEILIGEMSDEPMFSEDTDTLIATLTEHADAMPDVIIDLQAVSMVNSSNLGAMLRLRTLLKQGDRKLMLCGLNDTVWSVFLATSLDSLFTFSEDVTTALAHLQLGIDPGML
jgi:anti-anti-sigma factor